MGRLGKDVGWDARSVDSDAQPYVFSNREGFLLRSILSAMGLTIENVQRRAARPIWAYRDSRSEVTRRGMEAYCRVAQAPDRRAGNGQVCV